MDVRVRPDATAADVPLEADSRVRWNNGAVVLAGCMVVLAALYFTRAVVIPIALATLLSFLLSPLVRGFERVGFGRFGSVLVVVVLAFGVLGAVGFGVLSQVTRLADDLPGYRHNVRAKVVDFQGATSGGVIDKLRHAVEDVMGAIDRGRATRGVTAQPDGAPVPVVMQTRSVLWQIPTLLEGLASAGLVLVLVIFMLLERRDLRDRLIRLIGYGRLAVTTRAFDEAAARISRYLLAQSLLNAGYGVTIGIGLSVLGVPYALLWGFLAAVLRFVPYVGPVLGAGMPVILSLAAFSGWWIPLQVIALFAVCELVTNMIVEPLVYGQSAGVSQVALLAAIAFWTWLWGPIGLVLATPLTVCLVVLSKNVPELRFIFFLLADDPGFAPDVRLYQRLLAADDDEALEVVAEYRRANAQCDPYDDLLVPVLARTSIDRANARLSPEEEQRLMRSARRLLAAVTTADVEASAADASASATERIDGVLGCPAASACDHLALQMLSYKLAREGVVLEPMWGRARSLEMLSAVEQQRPRVVCIAALPPGGAVAARYLCRRLRSQFPELPIVVLVIGNGADDSSPNAALLSAGANVVVDSVCAARDAVLDVVRPAPERRQLAV